MKIIKQTFISSAQPEDMRVVKDGGLYEVQTYNPKREKWITQKEHTNVDSALTDLDNWY